MTHSLKKIESGKLELLVELNREELKKYIDKVRGEIIQGLDVDGFRKGKVPDELADKHIDQEQLLQAALSLTVKDSLAKVIELEKIDVMNSSDLEIKENSADLLKYKVILTIFPDIKIGDFSDLKVNKKTPSVNDDEVNETINSIRASRAKLLDKDGPVENGDRVEVDFEVKADDKVIEGGISKNHPVIIGGKSFIPGFEDALVGAKKDEVRTFSLVGPADYFQKDIAGKKLDFSVKINNIQLVQLPTLDDDFAKNVGRFKNLDELKNNIKDGLFEEKKMKEKQRVRLEVLDQIIKISDIKTPEAMINEQLNSMIANFDNDLHSKDMELSLYLAHIKKTQDDLKKDWRPEAEKQLKMALIIHKVAKDNKISASETEIQNGTNEILQSFMARGDLDLQKIDQGAIRDEVVSRIVNEKTLAFIEKTCSA